MDNRLGRDGDLEQLAHYRQDLKSDNSRRHAYVRFENATDRNVDVIWINYEGARVKYKTLEPREHFDVTSYVSHPWIFRDSETQTKLVVCSKEVYDCPSPVFVKLRDGVFRPTRSVVKITLPMYSLKEFAMQTIQRVLRSPGDASKLEIPKKLQDELYQRSRITCRNRRPVITP